MQRASNFKTRIAHALRILTKKRKQKSNESQIIRLKWAESPNCNPFVIDLSFRLMNCSMLTTKEQIGHYVGMNKVNLLVSFRELTSNLSVENTNDSFIINIGNRLIGVFRFFSFTKFTPQMFRTKYLRVMLSSKRFLMHVFDEEILLSVSNVQFNQGMAGGTRKKN